MGPSQAGWVVTDGRGRFLAACEPEAWAEDAAQALVFLELWQASARPGIVLPWATAMQVGHMALAAGPA
ncbi:MAG: hypothetical protein QOI63_85 [Thermoplasmata archaeon]|jgi:hypothetical protein|nr:hypothetical protein [Thermoplasmata archaeon]